MYSNNINGRVNIKGPIKNQFELFDNNGINLHEITDYNEAMTGNWLENVLSKTFFSTGNIQIIQNGIRAGVYQMSNGRFNVGPQDNTNLKIIMRSIFLQYAANNPNNIQEQVKNLNKLVLDYCIPNVHNEAIAYLKYKNDVSTLAVPESRPVNVSSKGDKVLELKKWF
jgi:hypothetical protein